MGEKTKGKPRGKPFKPGHPWRFPPGISPNPGGISKPLRQVREAIEAILASEYSDGSGRSYAEVVAMKLLEKAITGDIRAVAEIRLSTEGLKLRTWRDDVIDLLRQGLVTPEVIKDELGKELAEELLAATVLHRS